MSEQFIKLQLHGDPAGDPGQPGVDPAGSNQQTPGAEGGEATPNAAKELLEFKSKYVPRDLYDKAIKRGDDFLAAIMENREGEIAGQQREKEDKETAEDIAKRMFVPDNNMSDIVYVENALKLRDLRIKAGERDPFLPDNPREEDYEMAQNVADVFADCLKLADGDNGAFLALLQSRIKDDPPMQKVMSQNNLRRR